MRKSCCKKEATRGSWSKEEDQKLIDYIKLHGEGCWSTLPKAAGLHRCGKSCKARWMNYLRSDIARGNFGHDEEDLIIRLHALLGNRWSLIAGRLPGRTENEVKNYWNFHIKKKLITVGLDPNNHRVHQTLPRFSFHASSGGDGGCPCSNINISPNEGIADHSSSACVLPEFCSSTDDDDDHAASSRGLKLDLTIACPTSSSGASGFPAAEKAAK